MKLGFVAVFAVLVLGGCASGTAMKAECEARHSGFPEIVQCTKALIAERNPGLMTDERAKLYVWRGEQLSQAVVDGRISNIDAKVAWQQMLVDMRAQNDAQILQLLATMPKPQPATPAARLPSATSTNCTSTTTTFGGITRTDCLSTTR